MNQNPSSKFSLFISRKNEFVFTVNQIDKIAYGAPVGLEHCVVFTPKSNVLCLLCCCIVSEEKADAHFSSELHSERYLRSLSPSTVINVDHENAEIRRLKLTNEFSSRRCPKVYHWIVDCPIPEVFKTLTFPEKRSLFVKKTQVVNYQNSKVAICDICNISFLSTNVSNYESHIFTDEHFEKLLVRQKIDRDERSFLNEFSDLPVSLRKSKNPFWRDVGSIASVQNFGEYGMELIFKDIVTKKYTCICCYALFDIEEKNVVVNHARSLRHIQAALSILNKDMAARLVFTRNETELKHLTLIYLQNYKAPIWEPKLRTFDPVTAYRLNRIVKIPRTLIRLTVMEPFSRDGYIRDHNLSGQTGDIEIPDDDDCVCLTRALSLTNLLLINVNTKNYVLWCMDCQLSFSLKLEEFKAVWIDHMLSDMHWERSVEISRNLLGRNYAKDEPSNYQPIPYDHSATFGKKKVPWIWNDDVNAFEFCINNKLVHTDVIHRENFHGVSNLYCTLCCENLPLASQGVTSHVRSLKHTFFYMHKYFCKKVSKIKAILAENSSEIATARLILRNFIADTLRVMPNVVEKVGLYDANPQSNISPEVQEIIINETRVNTHQILLVRTLARVSQLPPTSAPYSLHDLSLEVPKSVNPKRQISLQLVFDNVLNNAKFPDARPLDLPPIITVPQPNPSTIKVVPAAYKLMRPFIPPNGPVISKIKLGQNGIPTIQIVPTVNSVPSVVMPLPVPPPTVPIKLTAAAMNVPMDISDEEPDHVKQVPSRRRRSHSRSVNRYRESSIAAQYIRDYGLNSPRRRSRSPICASLPSMKKSRFSPSIESSRNGNRTYSQSRSPEFRSRRLRSPSPQRRITNDSSRCFTDNPSRYVDNFTSRGNNLRRFVEFERHFCGDSRSQSPNRRRFTENRHSSPNCCRTPSRSRSPIDPINGYHSPPRRSYNEYPKKSSDLQSRSPIHPTHDMLQTHCINRSPIPIPRQCHDYFRLHNHSTSPSKSQSDSCHSLTIDGNNLSRSDSHFFMHENLNNVHSLAPFQELAPELSTSVMRGPTTYDELRRQQMVANLPKITPDTTILPTVDLTKLPPIIPASPIVPQGYGMPLSVNFGIPPPIMSSYAGFPAAGPPPVVDIEAAKARAKRDLYDRDLSKLETIPELINYLEQQGQDPIPPSDPPLFFNEIIKKKKGILGTNLLAQVLCYDCPELETYLCTMCREWTTVSEIFNHLKSTTHRLNYMSKMYKAHYAKAIVHDDVTMRDKILNESVMKISAIEGTKACNIRMRCILNVNQISRIWPQYEQFVDNSWKIEDDDDFQPPLSQAQASSQPPFNNRDRRTRENERSSEARSSCRVNRDRERDSYKEKERDRERYDRNRTRCPSRNSRDNSSRRYRRELTPEDNRPIWEKQAEIMRSVIDATVFNSNANIEESDRRKRPRKLSKSEASPEFSNDDGGEEKGKKQFVHDYSNSDIQVSSELKLNPAEKSKREQEAEKAKLKEAQKYISTLVLISQEAAGPQGVDKDIADRICSENNVDPEVLFSEEVLEDAGKRVGGDMIITFTAIAHHYKNPLKPPPRVLQERAWKNQPHAVSILRQIGLDKSAIALLLRKVTKVKMGEEAPIATRFSSRVGLTPEEKRLRRGKRGGVKIRLKALNNARNNTNNGNYGDEYNHGNDNLFTKPGLPAGYYERFMQSTATRSLPSNYNQHAPFPLKSAAHHQTEGYYDYEVNSHPYENPYRNVKLSHFYSHDYDYSEYPFRIPLPSSQSANAQSQLASMAHVSSPYTSSGRSSLSYYADLEPMTDFRSITRAAPSTDYEYSGPSSKALHLSAHRATLGQLVSKELYSFNPYTPKAPPTVEHSLMHNPMKNPSTVPSFNWEDAAQELSNLFK